MDLTQAGHMVIRAFNREEAVDGEYAPIIGRVCMDQFMVDVSHIDGVKVRDDVTLIGQDGDREVTVEEVAAPANSFNTLPSRVMFALASPTPLPMPAPPGIVSPVSLSTSDTPPAAVTLGIR